MAQQADSAGNQKDKKLNEVYILTTIMCVFVTFIHLTSGPVTNLMKGSFPHALFFILNKSVTFVVPGFVFLSGLKLAASYREKAFVFSDFILKRLRKIAIPYLFWYFVFYAYFRWQNFVAGRDFFQHLYSLIMGDLVSPFYFVTIIMQFYLIFGIIINIFRKYNNTVILLSAFIINILYFKIFYFKYQDRFFATYFVYFILGCYAAFNLEKFRNILGRYKFIIAFLYIIVTVWYVYKAYMSAVFGVYFSDWLIWGVVFGLISILFYYWLSYLLSRRVKLNLFTAVEGASYYIFLSHCIVLYICDFVCYRLGFYSVAGKFVIAFFAIYLTVFPACVLYNNIRSCIKQAVIRR